jgi:hypothetical protein
MAEEPKQDDMDSLSKDIEQASAMLVAKERDAVADKAREEGRKEAEREFQLNQQLEEQAKKMKELEEQLAKTRGTAEEQLSAIKTKVDEMASSKAVLSKAPPMSGVSADVERLNDKQLDMIEVRSAKAFFGPDYDRMLDQAK